MDNNVEKTLVSRKLTVSVADGTTAGGTARLRSRSLGNVDPEASSEDLHAVAVALTSLMDPTTAAIYIDDRSLLSSIESD